MTDKHEDKKLVGAEWFRCRKCGHKLFRITDWGYGGGGYVTLEIKCHSCKEVQKITLYA